MNAAKASQVRLYVAGRLDDAARNEFEMELFHDEELLLAVESEQALRAGLPDLPRPAGAVVSLPVRRTPPWLPIAAAFVVGVTSTALLVPHFHLGPGIEANVPIFLLENMRAENPAPRRFRLSPSARQLVLQMQVESGDGASYRLTVRNAQNVQVLRVESLRPNAEGLLALAVPANALPPGAYRAEVERQVGGTFRADTQVEFQIEGAKP